MKKHFPVLVITLIFFILPVSVAAQTPILNKELFERIRKEENDNSQIMRTLHVLTDIYGPRLTGSPNNQQAAKWAIKQMQSWGLQNTHLEAWDFGHPGWTNERLSAYITSPVRESLSCKVLAWTPGTNGTVRGAAYQVICQSIRRRKL